MAKKQSDTAKKRTYTTEPIPPMRRFAVDAGYLGRRRHIVHALIEVDVTGARRAIRAYARATGEKLSFTAFIIHCLTHAIQQHPHLHAYRDWRNRLVIYEDVNVTAMFEVEFGRRKIPMPHVFRATNRKSLIDIHRELRNVQSQPHASAESRFMHAFLILPAFLRRAFYWVVMRFPQTFRDASSPVMVTAVGMFGDGGGWAITMPNFTLNVAVDRSRPSTRVRSPSATSSTSPSASTTTSSTAPPPPASCIPSATCWKPPTASTTSRHNKPCPA